MARIAGIELQDKWRLDYALTNIKGIGWALSEEILNNLKIDTSKRVSKLTPPEITRIAAKIGEFPTEGELGRITRQSITRLKTIGSYRGSRHAKNLPTRGQRTKTNARSNRGSRKTVGSFKKEQLVKAQQATK